MKRRLTMVMEGGLFLLVVAALYVLALLTFPLFREASGILAQVYLEGDLPFPPPVLAFLSVFLFALAGALLAHWTPALSLRHHAVFWCVTYLLYWADPLLGLAGTPDAWMTTAAVALGAVLLLLFFAALSIWETGATPQYQAPTWRTRFAGGWLIVWMGFFAGTSAVLLSEVPLYPLRRLVLSLAAMAMAGWSYALSVQLRKAQGEEEAGVTSTWRWLVGAWALLAVFHYLFRVRSGG